jgi:hypothetical protein
MNIFDPFLILFLILFAVIVFSLRKLNRDKKIGKWTVFSTVYKWCTILYMIPFIIFFVIVTYDIITKELNEAALGLFISLNLYVIYIGVPYFFLSLVYLLTDSDTVNRVIRSINNI